MNHLEKEVIGYMREALVNFDIDLILVRENINAAHNLFASHLMEWSEEFCTLYNQMLTIYRAHTPQPKGHYRFKHVAIGYSSFSVQTWVADKVQPPIPSADELVARFDQLISEYTNTKEAA